MPTIELLKRKLISIYVWFLSFVLVAYSFAFYFFLGCKPYAYYLFFYCLGIFYTWLIVKKYYPVKNMVHLHLISGSLFSFIIMLNFWKYSVASATWLLPIPFAAYIFLEKKYSYIYSVAVAVIITFVSIFQETIHLDFFSIEEKRNLIISDTAIIICNLITLMLLTYYNERIKKEEERVRNLKLEEIRVVENQKRDEVIFNDSNQPTNVLSENQQKFSVEESEKYNILFLKIKEVIEAEKSYKNSDFSISHLAYMVKSNNVYVSFAIKNSGYSSFNHFINTYRVRDVKELILKNDLNKVTLMYIYTDCGFCNQSTFNRAFKQVEGITPSEFIKGLKS